MSVFVRREARAKPGFAMGILLGRKEVKGDIGLEIEVEGTRFPKPPGSEGTHHAVSMPGLKYWSYVHDGSLRGDDNAEYLLTKPIAFNEVPEAVNLLFEKLAANKATFDDSNRTSVHVHLNAQQFHLNRLTSFLALWFCCEEILTAYCGEHRVGNLFCLRAVDAPAIITQLKKFIQADGKKALSEHLHYAGLNAHALMKYGSLEVRMLRGCSDPSIIIEWAAILERLYTFSAEFPDPRDICGMFSSDGPLSFYNQVLGDKATPLREAIGWTEDQIRDSMYVGVRMAQDLCYCRDWDIFNPIELKPDPFGRDLKKVVKQMEQNAELAALTSAVDNIAGSVGLDDEETWMPDEDEMIPQMQPVNHFTTNF